MAGSSRHRGARRGQRHPVDTTGRYPRSARVNELLREVLADAIGRFADADERPPLLTITAVRTDPDLRHAVVLLASLEDEAKVWLDVFRPRLQATVAQQVRLRRTPLLSFVADPAVATGARVEEILRDMRTSDGRDQGGEVDDGP